MARRVSSPEFVGREPELAALLEALDRARGGQFAAAFIGGDAGVGKSRLLGELEGRGAELGARVLVGGCVSLAESELPYAPIRSALRGLFSDVDRDEIDEVVGTGREELARLVPELGSGGASAETAQPLAQARLFDLVLATLGRLGQEEPVVLAIEDIHWADRSTLDLIAFLVANARRERLLFACTYRTDEIHRGHPLRSFLAHHGRPPVVERMTLAPFTRVELARQLEGILGRAPDPALVSRLHKRTEGNAFFTEELLMVSAEGTQLPESLRDALMLRVEGLPQPAQEVLRMAATHGRLVTHRLLAAASDLPDPDLHDALREAVARHVLVREDEETYAFRHALLQEVLARDLLPGERASLHLALAEAGAADPTLISRDGRAAAELYAHWLGAHRLPDALAAAVRAGLEAEEIAAYADACRQFERALDLWNRVDEPATWAGMEEADLYSRAAEAAYLGGDPDGATRLVRVAISKTDPNAEPFRAALLRERLGRYLYYSAGDTEGALGAYQEGLDLLPAGEPRQEHARLLAALARMLMLRGQTSESMERAEQAIAVARQVGAQAEEAHALNTLGVNLSSLGERKRGIDHLREALGVTQEVGDLEGEYLNLSDCLARDGRLEEAVEVALSGARRAREIGMRNTAALLEAEAASRLVELGRLDEADRLTEDAAELPPSLSAYHQRVTRARLEVQRAHADEADHLLTAGNEAVSHAPGATWIEPEASARIELELMRGRPEKARRAADRALGLWAEHEYVFYTARVHALGARAEAAIAERARAVGDEEAAAEAVRGAEHLTARLAGMLDPAGWRGTPPPDSVAWGEACAAEAARAAGTATAEDWAAVAERWAGLRRAVDEAYARLREAECLLLDGERQRAEASLRAGLRLAKAAGASWLEYEFQALARRGRLSVPEAEPPVAGDTVERLGLTPRELSVLELVAQGKTNRQIGEELFMSEKTASVHVSRILTKLEVGSRVEAATAAHRLGIVA